MDDRRRIDMRDAVMATMSSDIDLTEYVIDTDSRHLDLDVIHAYLVRSYWSRGIPREVVQRAIMNSMCFGMFHRGAQVGFARVVTDRATFAYLADVFVLEEQRGRGLGKWLIATIVAHSELQGLRRFLLGTRDAHGLYRQFGFKALTHPSRLMEILRANAYHLPENVECHEDRPALVSNDSPGNLSGNAPQLKSGGQRD